MLEEHRRTTQISMSLVSLEAEVPQDYYLRRLDKVLDLRFVRERVRHLYCADNGRPAIDPEVIIRLFLLQAIEGIASVRQLMTTASMHAGYRWFLGIPFGQALPDHSTLSRAMARFGNAVFDELFTQSIEQCRQSGLIAGKVVHVDATTIRADLDRDKVNKVGSADGDARFGRFPGNHLEPGYKQHTAVDDASRVVLAVAVTPANVNEGGQLGEVLDQTRAHLGQSPEVVCADSAYVSGQNAHDCQQQGVRLVSPPPPPRTATSKDYFTIEQFAYDQERDVFVCPQGKELLRIGPVSGRKRRFLYRAQATDCRTCPLKARCTKAPSRAVNAGEHHAALVRLRADSRTESFKALYRRRGPVIEGIFAEGKQWHGLRRTWRRGLAKVRVQCLLIAAVLNFKRLVSWLGHTPGFRPMQPVYTRLWRGLVTFLVTIARLLFTDTEEDPVHGYAL